MSGESGGEVRVVALGVVRREEELLVREAESPASGSSYRPLGGPVRFGEHSVDALRRTFRESLEAELSGVGELGTFESVFEVGGERRHEVARVYEASIAQRWPRRLDSFPGYDPEEDEEFDCLWKPPSAFTDGDESLYPRGLAARL